MAPRRQLVSRSRLSETSSPAQRRRRDEESEDVQPTPLPPYEPPSCPLSVSQKHALDSLRLNYDDAKYKKHLAVSKKNVTNAIGESNDRLTAHKAKVRRTEERVRQQGREKTGAEIEEEQYTKSMEKKVADLTARGEKAMRDLIDYSDELAMQDSIMTEVSENIAAAPAPRPTAGMQRRSGSEDGEEDEEINAVEAPAADVAVLSPVELLKKAKEDYITTYTSKSMRDRYVNNDYRGFKQTVHDAIHPGDDAPPVPHASTWFPADEMGASRNGRHASSADKSNNESDQDEDDDDVIIASATTNLKCPLTLQIFVEPYSNNVCKHSFEKEAIIAYHRENGVAFVPSSQRRGARPTPQGPKQVKCPALGCDAMLELDDFFDDQLLLRQVKRAQRKKTLEMEDDEDEAGAGHRGARAEEIDDEGESILNEQRRQSIARVKRERQSRGPSMGLSQRGRALSEHEGEDEAMDTPESEG